MGFGYDRFIGFQTRGVTDPPAMYGSRSVSARSNEE